MTDRANPLATALAFRTGDFMKKSLELHHVSAKEMAAYLDVEPATVSRWLNNKRPPSLQTLRLWAMRTGVPLTYLQTGEIPSDGPVGPEGLEPPASTVKSRHLRVLTQDDMQEAA